VPTDLIDAHELLISEYEILEREFDQLRVAKERYIERQRKEIRELRQHLRLAMDEVTELQSLLGNAWVR
jgi:hypothetical protein